MRFAQLSLVVGAALAGSAAPVQAQRMTHGGAFHPMMMNANPRFNASPFMTPGFTNSNFMGHSPFIPSGFGTSHFMHHPSPFTNPRFHHQTATHMRFNNSLMVNPQIATTSPFHQHLVLFPNSRLATPFQPNSALFPTNFATNGFVTPAQMQFGMMNLPSSFWFWNGASGFMHWWW